MGQISTYDPASHSVSFLGNLFADGFGTDTFIKAARNEDGFTFTPSVSGGGTRNKNNNKSGTLELTVMSDSQANDILSALALQDELLGTAIGPLFLKDSNGTTRVSAQNAWIKKQPDIERQKEVGMTTWVFESDSLKMFSGGLL